MFGISFEHLLIVGVILLLVGPRRLPELGMTMGKAIKNFKDSFSGVEEASFKKLNEKTTAQSSADAAASTVFTSTNPATHAAPETHQDAPSAEPRV